MNDDDWQAMMRRAMRQREIVDQRRREANAHRPAPKTRGVQRVWCHRCGTIMPRGHEQHTR